MMIKCRDMDPLFKKHIIPGRGEKLADHGAKYDTWKVNVQIVERQ